MNPRLISSLSIAVWVAMPVLLFAQAPKSPTSVDSGSLLQAPVDARFESARPAPIPSQDIRTVRADLPDDLPKPVRFSGVRTAEGDRGVQGTSDRYDSKVTNADASQSKVDPEEIFLRSRRTNRSDGNSPRVKAVSAIDEPMISRDDRRRESNRLRDMFEGDKLLRSDDCFSNMISPVTNPYLFEDPRAITEVRPTMTYQRIPVAQPNFLGGNLWYFGGSARLALNEQWSITLNKIGAVAIDPGSASGKSSELGFGEIHIGPKFTFLRDTETQSILATGLIFQIPFGSGSVYQDTGKLSLVPYLSGAKILYDTPYGTLNGVATTGYSFSVNHDRNDYYYLSGNINYDIGNMHRFYPLFEMNYFLTTTDGQARPDLHFDGRDFANIGGMSKGANLLTAAFGARYKISERAQIGAAYELPVMGNRDLFRYRFTVDFILRF